MADLETVKKYRPSALAITEPETKETIFKIGIGTSSANDFGISFGGVSNDAEKLATATMPIPHEVEDAKEFVLDKAGLAIANLNKIEANIVLALDEIRTERDAVAESIKVSV
jgi:hypothetical protein